MPISVSCPSCSAGFKVKDEYAGKRAKCPKCANPLTIPAPAVVADFEVIDDEPAPAPKAAPKPVVASKPKPVVADDDEPVHPKRKRGEDDADEPVSPKRKRGEDDEQPVSPKRKRGKDDEPVSPKRKRGTSGDDEDEAPKRKRRRDDDEPKKKGKALPIILGVVGGLLLLCGGGCAGVWFGVLVPAAEQAKKRNDEKQAELDRWEKELNKPPANPGWNPNPNPATGTTPNTNTATGGTPKPTRNSALPVATLSPDEFVRDHNKYIDKWVIVKGKVTDDVTDGSSWGNFQMEHKGETKMSWDGSKWVSAVDVKTGATVEVWGYVMDPKYVGGKLQLRNCLLSTPCVSVTAAELLDEQLATPSNKAGKYDGRPVRLTGKVVRTDFFYAVVEERTINGMVHQVKVNFEGLRSNELKAGDPISVLVSGRDLQDSGDGKKEIVLLNARILPSGK